MAERTIHFDNAREAQDVTGPREEYLPPLEATFGVTAVSRDLWLKLEGEPRRWRRRARSWRGCCGRGTPGCC
jgi:phosphate starvation-inducible protein PhoH